MNILGLVKKHSGKILLAGSLVGYGVSLYLTAKSALAVNEIVDKDIEKKEKRKEIVKAVAPSAVSIALTISCIIFSYVTNQKKEAALTGALITVERTLHTYRRHLSADQDREITTDIYSEKADHINREHPQELDPDECLFCESMTGKTFVMKERDFALAMNEINRNMQLKDAVSFNEWLLFLGLDPIDNGDQYGWSVYSDEFYGYKYIDFWVSDLTFKDGTPYKLITYPFLPHSDYECPDECWSGLGDTYMDSVV